MVWSACITCMSMQPTQVTFYWLLMTSNADAKTRRCSRTSLYERYSSASPSSWPVWRARQDAARSMTRTLQSDVLGLANRMETVESKLEMVEQHFDGCRSDSNGLKASTYSAEALWSKKEMEDESSHDPHCDVHQTSDDADLMDKCFLSHHRSRAMFRT